MTITTLLWDADGVLQHGPSGWNWRKELDRVGGPGFAEAVFEAELPALIGRASLRTCLETVLHRWPGIDLNSDDLIGLWEMASVDPEAFAYVGEVRRRGVACHLATNQQDHRRRWMRDARGYDEAFDRSYYSCELGVAKPDPAFFAAILDDLGLRPDQVGFIDDSEPNVSAARALGIATYHHPRGADASTLRAGVESLLASP
jgi:putative hydrolase of the HAD superfamily